MQSSIISPLYYSLDNQSQKPLAWTATQERSISREYPLDFTFTDPSVQDGTETPDDFVARAYLQFLWLPESIVPLDRLIPSLSRITSQDPAQHPLHALLDPLLLTPRAISKKYHIELPQILLDGGGAGEMEEAMMWYTLNHEKVEELEGEHEEPWANETWRKKWLDRLERREVQLQILLHLLKLSLPGSSPPTDPPPPSPKKRKLQQPAAVLTTADNLELLVDKLSMWQLVGDNNTASQKDAIKGDDRDWAQIFCEDLVERQFMSQLPEACAILRNKLFPNSPFSDDDMDEKFSSPSPSPPPSGHHDDTQAPKNLPGSTSTSSRSSVKPSRSRSRSLSVSLAHDAEARKAGVGMNTKRILNREVSMSRVFKAKRKDSVQEKGPDKDKGKADEKKDKTTTAGKGGQPDEGITLVAATPVKVRSKSKSRPLFQPSGLLAEEDEEIWDLPSSPDILLLGGGSLDDDVCTPVKRSRTGVVK